jgi:hypothetical protein
MVRAVLVLLTIGGISACPLVCTESGHSTGREHSGHRDRAPDPCGQHGCVCKGAVQCRDDPAPEATPVLAAPYDAAVALSDTHCLGAEAPPRYGDGPPRAHLESGRAMRLVLESLLL